MVAIDQAPTSSERPWDGLVNSIEKRRSHEARFFKPVCLIAVIDGVLAGEILPAQIDPNIVLAKFQHSLEDVFPDRADLGWRPFWHLSNDGAWEFRKEGRIVEPSDFGTPRKPDSRGQLLTQIDHVSVPPHMLPHWLSVKALHSLRNSMLGMLEKDDAGCQTMAAKLRSEAPPPFEPSVGTMTTVRDHGPKNDSQGFQQSKEYRTAIERRAMHVAFDILELEGWIAHDVSSSESYDIHCLRGHEKAYVEVKGTSGSGEQIILTNAEVQL